MILQTPGTAVPIAVKPLPRARLDDVLQFLKTQYGDDYYGANEAFFDWQYLKTPCLWFRPAAASGLMPVNAVLSDTGDLMAVHAFIPFDAKTPWGGSKGIWDEEWINGSSIPGLGRLMADSLRENVDLYIGFGCNELSESAFKKIGLAFTPEVTRLVMLLDPGALEQRISEAGLEPVSIPHHTTAPMKGAHRILMKAADIPQSLLDLRTSTMGCGPMRSSDWVSWRYDLHPFIDYWTVISDHGPDGGAAILRIEPIREQQGNVCRVLDLYFGNSRDDRLLGAVLSFARERDCLLVDYFSTSAVSVKRLAEAADRLSQPALKNPHIPYMFQPLAMGPRNSFNAVFAASTNAPHGFGLSDVLATKADSTQDIERHPNSTAA